MRSLRRYLAFCLLATWWTLICQSDAVAQQVRTWSDASGNFSVDASLKSHGAKAIELITVDGRTISVPKDKLSQSDLDYLSALPAAASNLVASVVEKAMDAKLGGSVAALKPGESLSDFFGRLGIAVFIDRSSLQKIGVAADVSLEFAGEGSSLAEQLDSILEPMELTWYRLRTVLVVCSKRAAQKGAMQTVVYRIPTPRGDPSSVIKRLRSVEPKSWEIVGGPGSIAALPGAFVIRQSGNVHRQLVGQLQVRAVPHRYVHPLDNDLVTVRMPEGSLIQFAEQLESQLDRKVALPESGNEEISLSVDLSNVAASDALEVVLSQCGYQWFENAAGLELIPDAYAREKLEVQRVTIPTAAPQFSSLMINMIMTSVEPRSWAPLGGAGKIQHAGGNTFQVSQTQPIVRQLRQLIADLGGRG